MENKNFIIVTIVKSNNSENNVWAVAVTGEEQPQGYCKSAYKAMRFAFLLKKRTGLNIDDQSLKSLSKQIAEVKAMKAEAEAKAGKEKILALASEQVRAAEVAQEFLDKPSGKAERVESHSVDAVLAQQPEQQAEAEQPKPTKQRKPRTKKAEAQVLALQ